MKTEFFWLVGGPQTKLTVDAGDLAAVRAELERRRWISYGTDPPIIRRYRMEGFGERLAMAACLAAPDLHAVARLVERGAGVSVLHSYLVQDRVATGRMRRLWSLRRPVQIQIWLVYRTADRNDAAISRFVRRPLARAAPDGGSLK